MKFCSAAAGLIALTGSVLGATLQAVSNFGANPSSIQMYIYVPDKVAEKPAVIVAVRNSRLISVEDRNKSLEASGKRR